MEVGYWILDIGYWVLGIGYWSVVQDLPEFDQVVNPAQVVV